VLFAIWTPSMAGSAESLWTSCSTPHALRRSARAAGRAGPPSRPRRAPARPLHLRPSGLRDPMLVSFPARRFRRSHRKGLETSSAQHLRGDAVTSSAT